MDQLTPLNSLKNEFYFLQNFKGYFLCIFQCVMCSLVLLAGVYFISYTIFFQDNIANSAPTPGIYYRFNDLFLFYLKHKSVL